MASTGPGSHRHRDSHNKWTTQPDPPHTHTIDLSQYVSKAAFDALEARVKKLEPVSFSFRTA